MSAISSKICSSSRFGPPTMRANSVYPGDTVRALPEGTSNKERKGKLFFCQQPQNSKERLRGFPAQTANIAIKYTEES